MSTVLAKAGRFQITECPVRSPDAGGAPDAAGSIQAIVNEAFDETGDITRLKWSLLRYDSAGSVFRKLLCDTWKARRALVIGTTDQTYVFMHKPEQAKMNFDFEGVSPAAFYSMPNPNNRHMAQQAVIDVFASLVKKHVLQTTMLPEAIEVADVKGVYEETRSMNDEDLHMEAWQAKQLNTKERDRCPTRRALCVGQSHLFRLRALERKRAAMEQRLAGIVCRPGSPDATKLVYPRDVPGLVQKTGATWCEKRRDDIEIKFTDYMETKLHFEKVLVRWGAAGLAKSPAARCIANYFAFLWYPLSGRRNPRRPQRREGSFREVCNGDFR